MDGMLKVTQIIGLIRQQERINKKIMVFVRSIIISSDLCVNLEMATTKVDSLSLTEESVLTVDLKYIL